MTLSVMCFWALILQAPWPYDIWIEVELTTMRFVMPFYSEPPGIDDPVYFDALIFGRAEFWDGPRFELVDGDTALLRVPREYESYRVHKYRVTIPAGSPLMFKNPPYTVPVRSDRKWFMSIKTVPHFAFQNPESRPKPKGKTFYPIAEPIDIEPLLGRKSELLVFKENNRYDLYCMLFLEEKTLISSGTYSLENGIRLYEDNTNYSYPVLTDGTCVYVRYFGAYLKLK